MEQSKIQTVTKIYGKIFKTWKKNPEIIQRIEEICNLKVGNTHP